MQLATDSNRRRSVRCRGDHGEVGLGVEQLGEPIAYDLMVVGDDDAHETPFCHAGSSTLAGRTASTRYPPPVAGPVRTEPPTAAARSCMPADSMSAGRNRWGRTRTVVTNTEPQRRVGVGKLHVDGGAGGVPSRVGERLLDDAVGDELDVGVEGDGRAAKDQPRGTT